VMNRREAATPVLRIVVLDPHPVATPAADTTTDPGRLLCRMYTGLRRIESEMSVSPTRQLV
jgi:hypothetical protein